MFTSLQYFIFSFWNNLASIFRAIDVMVCSRTDVYFTKHNILPCDLYFELKFPPWVIPVLIIVTFHLKLFCYLILTLSFLFSCVFQNVKLKIVKHVLITIFAQNVRRACIHTVDDVMSAVLQARAPQMKPWSVSVSVLLLLQKKKAIRNVRMFTLFFFVLSLFCHIHFSSS